MKRSRRGLRQVGLDRNIDQIRAWHQRTQDTAATAARALTRRTSNRRGNRRNDAQWRADCLELRGDWCRVPHCPHPQPVQMDHLIPRAHGGPSVVENGWPVCRRHHELKTGHLLLVDPTWLDLDQRIWLRDHNYVTWLLDGVAVGTRRRIFADARPDHRLYDE